jgi:hypothetical protein
MSPLSAASETSFWMAASRWLMVEAAKKRWRVPALTPADKYYLSAKSRLG